MCVGAASGRMYAIVVPTCDKMSLKIRPCEDYRNGKIDIEIKINELKENFNGMSIKIYKKKQLQQLEKVANLNTYPSQHLNSFCYDDDDDDDDDDEEYTIAIISDLPTEEPDNSLSMGDEHLSTIPETESDKVIKSSVENLILIPSEFKDFSDIESECDVPVCDNFTTFSNTLFDDDDFPSSDDESFSNEDVPKEIYLNPLFDEEIIFSPKSDSFLEEFSSELAHINLIPPGINEADFDPEEEIHRVERLLYDNSSPRPPEEEIDLFLTPDDLMPLGIKNDDYNSEGDILFLEELLSNNSISLPKNKSFHSDFPSSTRPPAKQPDDGIYFKPDTGLLTTKVDCPDFEASRASGFCPSFTRASNPQLHYGNWIS
ncbi:hypothetical protein Tco_0205520 [Tanacetum coccineum]